MWVVLTLNDAMFALIKPKTLVSVKKTQFNMSQSPPPPPKRAIEKELKQKLKQKQTKKFRSWEIARGILENR